MARLPEFLAVFFPRCPIEGTAAQFFGNRAEILRLLARRRLCAVELDEEWARSAAGAGSAALRVELSICDGSELLAKVPTACVDSGRAFIPWPQEDEDGRLVVARWQYDLCRVISPGEYLGAYPVRSYLQRAGIVVI